MLRVCCGINRDLLQSRGNGIDKQRNRIVCSRFCSWHRRFIGFDEFFGHFNQSYKKCREKIVILKDSDMILTERVAFSTLLQNPCHKKQETEEGILKICGYIYHHDKYIPLWGVRHTFALF